MTYVAFDKLCPRCGGEIVEGLTTSAAIAQAVDWFKSGGIVSTPIKLLQDFKAGIGGDWEYVHCGRCSCAFVACDKCGCVWSPPEPVTAGDMLACPRCHRNLV
jgi:hypothetical protein